MIFVIISSRFAISKIVIHSLKPGSKLCATFLNIAKCGSMRLRFGFGYYFNKLIFSVLHVTEVWWTYKKNSNNVAMHTHCYLGKYRNWYYKNQLWMLSTMTTTSNAPGIFCCDLLRSKRNFHEVFRSLFDPCYVHGSFSIQLQKIHRSISDLSLILCYRYLFVSDQINLIYVTSSAKKDLIAEQMS